MRLLRSLLGRPRDTVRLRADAWRENLRRAVRDNDKAAAPQRHTRMVLQRIIKAGKG